MTIPSSFPTNNDHPLSPLQLKPLKPAVFDLQQKMKPTDPKIPVSYNSATLHIPILPLSLSSFLHRTQAAFSLLPPFSSRLQLAFETTTGDLAGVSTDFALQLTLGADPTAGRLVLVPSGELPTVDECMRTVLQCVVDTAAGGEAAAVFLALSGAWEVATREFGDSGLASREFHANGGSGEPLGGVLRRTVERGLEGRVDADLGRQMAELAVEGVEGDAAWETDLVAAAERRVLEGFRRHEVWCEGCGERIIGNLYRGEDDGRVVELCEACRRRLEGGECTFVVYEHPWESGEEYEGGGDLEAPRPPLGVGDVGGRVMHLQFVLYKAGFLGLGGGFRLGVFCRRTEEALARFQREFGIVETGYGGVTRGVLGSLFEQVERGVGVRCAGVSRGERVRVRTAMAA